MRLVKTIWEENQAQKMSEWLEEQGLEVELQPYPEQNPSCWRIWVLDEDQLDKAKDWIEQIEAGKLHIEDSLCAKNESPLQHASFEPTAPPNKISKSAWLTQSLMTIMITIHVVLHLFLTQDQANLFVRKLVSDDPSLVNKSGVWEGCYTQLVHLFKGEPLSWNWPDFLFDARQGELWRLFSPILLHADWIHLIFNMLWFNMLGSIIELKIGRIKFLALILISALVSNFFQYTASGFAFLGFSGVVMAFVGFIYARCHHFPWEDYPLSSSTFNFIGLYLILTLSLQVVSFILETLSMTQTTVGIANTAHLTGLFIGWALGRSRAMSLKP